MPRQGITKEMVVRTAAVLVEESGYDNLTLHKLAAELHIKPASLYTHIKGIDELYESLSYFALSRLSCQILDAVQGKEQGEALHAMAASYYDYAKQNPEMYRVILKVPHSNREKLIEAGRNVKSILFEVLSHYTDDRAEMIYYSRCYHSMLHGFVSLEQAGFFDDAVPAEESMEKMVHDFIRQLNKR